MLYGKRGCTSSEEVPWQPAATKRAILVAESSGAGGEVPSVLSLSSSSQVLWQLAFLIILTHLTDENRGLEKPRIPQHSY